MEVPPPPAPAQEVTPPPPLGANASFKFLPPPPAVPVVKTAPNPPSLLPPPMSSRPPTLLPPQWGQPPPANWGQPPPVLLPVYRPPPPAAPPILVRPPAHLTHAAMGLTGEVDLEKVEDDGSFNPLLDPNYATLQLALAQAVERDPEGAAAWYMEVCGGGPRAMVKKIVEGIVPGNSALNRSRMTASGTGSGGMGSGMMNVPGPPGGGGGKRGAPGGNSAGQPSGPGVSKPSPNGLPQRYGTAACIEFVKTGGCSFGMECPYNHP